jgi:hypothetical protein
VDWARTELPVYNPLWINNKQRTIVVNISQNFAASMHTSFFQGQADRGLFYWPEHSGEAGLPLQEEKEGKAIEQHVLDTYAGKQLS